MLSYEQFVARVLEGTGDAHKDVARRAINGTVEALGEILLRPERAAIAASIPAQLRAVLLRRELAPELDLAGFYAAVSERAGLAPAFAMEHAQVVCGVVSECLEPELRERLARDLPDGFRELFAPRHLVAALPARMHHSPSSTPPAATLAEGRPGSARPLSESSPERAHEQSVARSRDPHAGTKISSAQGEESDAIADARSRGKRPISGG